MPGTAMPTTSGRSSSSRLTCSAGDMAFDHVAVDQRGVAGRHARRHACVDLHRDEVVQVARIHLEAGLPHVIDPQVAAPATGRLVDERPGQGVGDGRCGRSRQGRGCLAGGTRRRFPGRVQGMGVMRGGRSIRHRGAVRVSRLARGTGGNEDYEGEDGAGAKLSHGILGSEGCADRFSGAVPCVHPSNLARGHWNRRADSWLLIPRSPGSRFRGSARPDRGPAASA